MKPATGSDEHRIFEDASIRNMSDLSPDGKILLVGRSDPKTGFDMWMLERSVQRAWLEEVDAVFRKRQPTKGKDGSADGTAIASPYTV